MQNFIYLIGDMRTREAVIVDCCWDFEGALKAWPLFVLSSSAISVVVSVIVQCSALMASKC